MRRLAAEAMRAGAIGFSTSRTLNHRTLKGDPMPSLRASEAELGAIALGMRDAGCGVLEYISDWNTPDTDSEFAMVRRLVRESGRPLSYSLAHWGRDRARGRLPVERLVKKLTSDNARAVGLMDRGVLAPGMKADVNVIDFDRLRVESPVMADDLPAGGRRLLQRAAGYDATIVAGQVTYRHGEPTQALPGRLVRGAQPTPVAA
jgi:N-acyl-D-aspartate/D-glutamate deacylase